MKNRLTYNLLLATVAVSLVIPRAGTKIGPIPATLSLLLYALTLTAWVCRPWRSRRIGFTHDGWMEDLAVYGSCIFMFFGALGLCLGVINGPDVEALFNEAAAFLGFVPVFFIIRDVARSETANRTALRIMVAGLFIVCLYGIAQRIFGHYKVMVPGITISYADAMIPNVFESKNNLTAIGLKVTSTFQNGNLYGVFLVLMMPVVIALISETKGRARRRSILLFILAAVNLLLSLSRGAIVSGIVSTMALAWFLRPKRTPLFIAGGYLLVGGIVAVVLKLGERLFAYDPTAAGRTTMWANLLSTYSDMGTFSFITTVLFGAGMGGSIGTGSEAIPGIEGSLITMFMKLGLIGCLAFGLSFYGVIRYAVMSFRRRPCFWSAMAVGLACESSLTLESPVMKPSNFPAITRSCGISLLTRQNADRSAVRFLCGLTFPTYRMYGFGCGRESFCKSNHRLSTP